MRYCALMVFLIYFIPAHGQILSGRVSNTRGEKLEGAVVFIQGTDLASITDKSGKYRLEGVKEGRWNVSCSFLGYETISATIKWPATPNLDFIMQGSMYELEEVEIRSNVHKITPFNGGMELRKEELAEINHGQDIPVLLQMQPSVVTNTDAGAGIGYTSLRIRGVEQSRINVTVNDIPINDAESQNVFWVDLPDIASSTESIRIQRGVGPSTNGAGAYGGTVSLNTFGIDVNPSVSADLSYGSFNTRKSTFRLNSGLMNNRFNVDARYSIIKSDGYIDRASADLKSWYIEGARVGSTSSLRLLAFSGTEETYQAWNGVPESVVKGDREGIMSHFQRNIGTLYQTPEDSVNLFDSGRNYNYYLYDKQVDNYTQTHVQLHYAKTFKSGWKTKAALHYTKGKGYFEQFRFQDELKNYRLPNIIKGGDTITTSDLVRRRWLDNDFTGGIFKLEKEIATNALFSIGGGYHHYAGDHFGNVIKVSEIPDFYSNTPYYESIANKKDGNLYGRFEQGINDVWFWSADLQLRSVIYNANGIDNDLRPIDFDVNYLFFNPKFSVTRKIGKQQQISLSHAIAHREPDRSDFTDHGDAVLPTPEKLYDTELSWKINSGNGSLEANGYYMYYKDQLIPTGRLNDVGNTLRKNVAESYRLGLELIGNYRVNNALVTGFNLTVSKNKIRDFTEIIYDYTNGFDEISISHGDTDIALSPGISGAAMIDWKVGRDMKINWTTKWVGRQYLDNTSDHARSIDPYSTSHLNITYEVKSEKIKDFQVKLQINNIFNTRYSSGGYTYSYIYENLITENFLYPQAGIHGMAGISIKI